MPNEQILNADLQTRRFVQAPTSTAPVALEFYQGDTHTLLLRGWEQSNSAPLGQIYVPAPISYTTMAAGLFAGKPDAAPEDGTFKLRFNGATTGELKWNIGKGELETALNALATVTTAGGLKVLAKGPSHFYTVQWNNGDPGANITAVEVELSPVCLVRIRANAIVPGQVLIKLVRAPLAYTEDFEYPTPPAVDLAPVRAGSVLRDEIQSLRIPDGATGEFALIWNLTETAVVSVADATAAEIARVLNELYTDGLTRFTVTNPGTRLFYIYFVGPLAKTDHPMLEKAMYSQTAVQAPLFKLPITAEVPVDLELLARENIPIVFEVAAWNGSEKTVIAQQTVTLINNAIDDELGLDLAESGAVQIITETVYVDESEGAPITTVSPGASYTPGEPGEEVIINHNLNTFNPDVRVYLKTQDDPEQWTKVPDDQYEAVATSENHVRITGIPMEADPDSEFYFERWKFYVASPDATVQLLTHEHPVTQVYRMVGGEPVTLDVILDELAASLPTGWPNIPSNKISGVILATQIDINSVAEALNGSAKFVTTLRDVLTDATIINTIATELRTNAAFEETLKTLLASESVVASLVETLKESNSYHDFIRETVLDVLQGSGGVLPDGSVLFSVPAFEIAVPAPKIIPAPSQKVEAVADVEVQIDDSESAGSAEYNAKKSGSLKVVRSKETQRSYIEKETLVFDLLSPMVFIEALDLGIIDSVSNEPTPGIIFLELDPEAPLAGIGDVVVAPDGSEATLEVSTYGIPSVDQITLLTNPVLDVSPGQMLRIKKAGTASATLIAGTLPATADVKLYESNGVTQARTEGPRRGRSFKNGTKIARSNGHWYEVRVAGRNLYAVEMEHSMFRVEATARMWKDLTTFAAQWVVAAALIGNAAGAIDIVVELGLRDGSTFSWTQVASVTLPLTDAVAFHQFEFVSQKGESSTTGSFKVYGEEQSVDLTAYVDDGFTLRVRMANFDCEVPDGGARGCLQLKCPAPNVSITPVEVSE